jgi:hypothetical protein
MVGLATGGSGLAGVGLRTGAGAPAVVDGGTIRPPHADKSSARLVMKISLRAAAIAKTPLLDLGIANGRSVGSKQDQGGDQANGLEASG